MKRLNERDQRLEAAITELLAMRGGGSSICPSEAARCVAGPGSWRELMEPARQAARRLANKGTVLIAQRGHVVDPSDFRGPIRIRAARR